jgi:hypothetical protein
MWVVGEIGGKKVALAVVYLGCGRLKRERNMEVIEKMGKEVLEWGGRGMRYV